MVGGLAALAGNGVYGMGMREGWMDVPKKRKTNIDEEVGAAAGDEEDA